MIPVDAWTREPDPVDEREFTPDSPPGMWHAWNAMSPEVEVCDFLPRLADTIKARTILETGVGQGFISRRLWDERRNWAGIESDPDLRNWLSDIGRGPLGFDYPLIRVATPYPSHYDWADLTILDSDDQYRPDELRGWAQHARVGAWCFLHDANPRRPTATGYWQYWKLAQLTGFPMWVFDNPRGSVLLYKDRDLSDTALARIARTPTLKGSVFIAQIDGGTVDGAFAHSMARMLTYSMQWPGLIGGYVRENCGPRIFHGRDQLVRHFLDATTSEWLLQIDSDMTFPHDLLPRMLEHADQEDRPIVAGHCYMLRGEMGPLPTMWTKTEKGEIVGFEGYPPNALVPVEGTGAACLLVHRRVFEKLRDFAGPGYSYPWFEETVYMDKPIGEDLTFCLRARSHGFPIYVDTSLDIGHVKPFVLNRETFADWRRLRRTIITGPDPDTLGWVATLLRRAGVSCGVESVYKPDGTVTWGTRWVDASRHALPHVDGFDGPYIVVDPDASMGWQSVLDGAALVVDSTTLDAPIIHRMLTICRVPTPPHPTILARIIGDNPRPG